MKEGCVRTVSVALEGEVRLHGVRVCSECEM